MAETEKRVGDTDINLDEIKSKISNMQSNYNIILIFLVIWASHILEEIFHHA